MYCGKEYDDDYIHSDAEPHGLPLLPGFDRCTLLAIHHRTRRPRTMTMHRTLGIILTHDTSISSI